VTVAIVMMMQPAVLVKCRMFFATEHMWFTYSAQATYQLGFRMQPGTRKLSTVQAASCCCEHRERSTMLLEWQSVQNQLCKSVRAPQSSAHFDMNMPGHVTVT
jgi:hypothetical protein